MKPFPQKGAQIMTTRIQKDGQKATKRTKAADPAEPELQRSSLPSLSSLSSVNSSSTPVVVDLPEDLHELLCVIAAEDNTSPGELIQQMLQADIDAHESLSRSSSRSLSLPKPVKHPLWIFALFAFFVVVPSSLADSFTGTVTRVIDGDTIVVGTNVVRLADIDAPELNQSHGLESKAALEHMVLDKQVRVESTKQDRYRRILTTIWLNGTNINHHLVACGAAWQYVKYSECRDLAALQTQARKQRIGLWRNPSILPPWHFRKCRRQKIDRQRR